MLSQYHLQLLHLSAKENQGRLAVIAIHFDYIFDDEQDLFLREWEKMRYQNEFKERVYSIAQRLEAAVFGDGLDQFFIVTTRNMLQNVFLKDNEHSKLLQFGQRSPQYRVWLGMGVGNTMLEARSRAAMALNHSIADRSGTSYLVENEGGTSSPIGSWDVQTGTYRLQRFAERTRLGMSTLRRLAQVLRQTEGSVTSEQLARRLFVSRSFLTERFRRETGVTIGRYLDDQLMAAAQWQLLRTGRSIGEISESLGYCDQFYFARRFKQLCGESPLQYRKKIRAGNHVL